LELILKKLIACAFAAVIFNSVHAQELVIPPNHEIWAGQQAENIKELQRTAENSMRATQALIAGFTATAPDQFIILRLPNATLALSRWGERYAFIDIWSNGIGGNYRDMTAEQWQAAFKSIAEHKQQPPAKPRRNPNRWSPGYAGFVHVRGLGKPRDYLLSTDDIYEYHNRNPVDAFVCRNLGNHCSTADWTTDGWILKLYEQLKKATHSAAYERDMKLCESVVLEKFDVAEQLLSEGADINRWRGDGGTCYGALHGPKYLKQRAWLVAHKASINKADFLGRAPKR
jgi:hypothetical protein